jgi:hypothetical protein
LPRASIEDDVSDDEGKANSIAPVGGVMTPAIVQESSVPRFRLVQPLRPEGAGAGGDLHRGYSGTTTFAWVLLPDRGAVPGVDSRVIASRAERIEIRIQTRPQYWFIVTIPMNAWKPTVRRVG